jgi:hypothetical protein
MEPWIKGFSVRDKLTVKFAKLKKNIVEVLLFRREKNNIVELLLRGFS